MRLALALCLSLAATAATAQDLPDPEALAGFTAGICLRATPEIEAAPDTGDFALVERDGDTVSYAHPSGVTLALAARPDFFSCAVEVPQAERGYFDLLIAAFGERFNAAFEADDFEQVEDGLVWQAYTNAGTLITSEAQYLESGRITLISSTETTQATTTPRDNN